MSKLSDEMDVVLRKLIADGKLVLDANKIADELYWASSVDHMTIGELKKAYVRQRLATKLYEMGYKSVMPGKGFYVDITTTDKINLAIKLIDNSKMNALRKEDAKELIIKNARHNDLIKDQEQYELMFDKDGKYLGCETVASDEEILKILSEEA